MAEEIVIPIVADDSGILESFKEIEESANELKETADELSESVNNAFKTPSVPAFKKNVDSAKKSLDDTDKTAKKTNVTMAQFNKTGGRSVSMLSRLGGVGGRATRSLGGLAFALGGTPFGAFALAAGAATAAYSLFADKLGFNNDAIIAKNKELRQSIDELTSDLQSKFKEGKLISIDLENISEAEKRTKKLAIAQQDLASLTGRLGLESAKFSEQRSKFETTIFENETKQLEAKEQLVKDEAALFELAAQKANQEKLVLGFVKEQQAEQKRAAAEREANLKAANRLINSIIDNEREKQLIAADERAKDREEEAKKVISDSNVRAKFLIDSERFLVNEKKKINAEFDDAELKARQALLAQLVIDEEKAAIQGAELAAQARLKDIENIATSENEKSELIKQSEQKLAFDLESIRTQFAEKRKQEQITEQQEFFSLQQASLESNIALQNAELENRQELAKQAFESTSKTEEEITAFKQQQDNERLTAELNFQIQRLKLVRDFNTQISDIEKQALDAQIKTLETKLKGVGNSLGKTAKENAKKGDGLFGLLGISADTQNNIQAVQGALEQVTAEVSKAVGERIKLLDQEIAKNNERVSELQNDLANEIELNKLGKASNIKLVQEQLAAEKAQRDKAQQERDEAAKAQFALDTVLQASNLVTAISGLYSSLSGLPFGIGVALATALSAVMIGSFIASKTSAANATKSSFAEGGHFSDSEFGYTGHGAKYEQSNKLGEKRYNYHKNEYIIPSEYVDKYGLENVPVKELDSVLGSHFSDSIPSFEVLGKANRRISTSISKQKEQEKAHKAAMLDSALKNSLNEQTKYLKEIANKPTVIPMPNGDIHIKYGTKTQIISLEK